jgi:DNA polymerase-4
MGIVRRRVPVVEVIGLDEAYLELTDLAPGEGPVQAMRGLVAEIHAQTGLTASVGIGPNKLVAKVASDAEKPRGFVMLSREQACLRFAQSPCGLIPGIGPRTVERLAAVSIRTIAQLAAADPEALGQAFGRRGGEGLIRLARFEHDGAVTEERKVVSESRETTFDQDISERDRLEEILERLVSELCATLERRGHRGRTIGIKVRLDDFSTHTRARTLSVPVNRADQVGPVAIELLRRFAPARPVRLLGVRVAGLEQPAPEGEAQLALAM